MCLRNLTASCPLNRQNKGARLISIHHDFTLGQPSGVNQPRTTRTCLYITNTSKNRVIKEEIAFLQNNSLVQQSPSQNAEQNGLSLRFGRYQLKKNSAENVSVLDSKHISHLDFYRRIRVWFETAKLKLLYQGS